MSVSVAEQMLFVVPLVYLCFTLVAFAFGVRSQKSLPRLMLRSSLPLFFSRSFMVSGLIHFELIVYVWCEIGVQFHSLACSCPVLSKPLKRLSVNSWLLYC